MLPKHLPKVRLECMFSDSLICNISTLFQNMAVASHIMPEGHQRNRIGTAVWIIDHIGTQNVSVINEQILQG
jgi:hypothetical protein